jgi:Tol biopolymer transport system component
VFTSNRDGAGDVYVMNADGGGVMRLTNTTAKEISAVWSPDGSRIVFDSERDGNRELYVMNSDGSDQTRLTFNPTADAGPVSFSPEGKRIAYARSVSDQGRGAYSFDIYTMNVDGSDQRQLTVDPDFDAEPIWSPDGTRILFISDRDGDLEIYAINPDGSREEKLSTSNSRHEGAFAFTADGKQVFCVADTLEKFEFLQIYLMNLDGTDRRRITSFSDKVYRVSYSKEAQKFAISSTADGNHEIYSMEARIAPGS